MVNENTSLYRKKTKQDKGQAEHIIAYTIAVMVIYWKCQHEGLQGYAEFKFWRGEHCGGIAERSKLRNNCD